MPQITKEQIEEEMVKLKPLMQQTLKLERMLTVAWQFLDAGRIGIFHLNLTVDQKDHVAADYITEKQTLKTMASNF